MVCFFQEDLTLHMESHKTPKIASAITLPRVCNYCDYVFDSQIAYREHIAYHLKVKIKLVGKQDLSWNISDEKINVKQKEIQATSKERLQT